MNKQLQNFARTTLKTDLAQCTTGQQDKFKRMYSFKNLALPINDVVDRMPVEKLDWAMQQVRGTLDKNDDEYEGDYQDECPYDPDLTCYDFQCDGC